jgi:hypothetical protein
MPQKECAHSLFQDLDSSISTLPSHSYNDTAALGRSEGAGVICVEGDSAHLLIHCLKVLANSS